MPYRKRKKPLRGIGVPVGAMCPIRPNVIWAMDFQFDQTSDGRMLKLLNVDRRVHPRGPGHRRRTLHRRRRRGPLPRAPGRRARRSGLRPLRPRPRVHRLRGGRLVPVQRHRHRLHRPRLAVAERLDRELQRPDARRAPQRPAVRQPARGQGPHRGLEDRLQHATGPTARTAGSPRSSSSRPGSTNKHTSSHSGWISYRGPLTTTKSSLLICAC